MDHYAKRVNTTRTEKTMEYMYRSAGLVQVQEPQEDAAIDERGDV